MSKMNFLCPECGGNVAVDRNGLGFELTCPHCAKTIPVPWETIPTNATGSPAASSLPFRNYRGQVDELARALMELCAYTAVNEWNLKAKQEQDRINQATQSADSALTPLDETMTNLFRQLDAARFEFKQQSFLKRIAGDHTKEKEIEARLAGIQNQRTYIEAEKSRLQEMSFRLQELVDCAARSAPKSPAEKAVLIKKLHQEKKDLAAKKRETMMAMTAIRQDARKQSANAGESFFIGYDPEAAASQRRGIRRAKETALAPLESGKATLEQRLINIEERLLWIERFE